MATVKKKNGSKDATAIDVQLAGVIVKKIPKKTAAKKAKVAAISISFHLRFKTSFGQNLFILGNHPVLGNGSIDTAIPLQYLNEEGWSVTIQWPSNSEDTDRVYYNYLLKNQDGTYVIDAGKVHFFSIEKSTTNNLLLIDSWNHAGYYENIFYTAAFQSVLLQQNFTAFTVPSPKKSTHIFNVKSPLLTKHQTLCIIGSAHKMGNWLTDKPLLMNRVAGLDYFELSVDFTKQSFPIAYKYGIYDFVQKQFIQFEAGNNRMIYEAAEKKKSIRINDGYTYLPNNTWKGAGLAIPVFSLRTTNSLGVGEFADLKLLADWSVKVGLKLIQILPINDTMATHSWKDSYPYAAISAFALHPLYLNLAALAGNSQKAALKKATIIGQELNALAEVDYNAVIELKIEFVRQVYKQAGKKWLQSKGFKDFFGQNKHWLVSYAVFCYLRDEYGTVDFGKWPAHQQYKAADITAFTDENADSYAEIAFHYFTQYHLHLQLKEATEYAHSKGIILKGDIAIGVYRYGADTWQHPELYHMNFQAGAPPDDFAITGQNWGFPTYNWQRMQEDGFAWWKQRFEQMRYYFDAFRIDHILGFFRIWSIPLHSVEGIMGHFVPALPVHINEFNQQGIWFNYSRYTQPYITDAVLWEIFGYDNELVKSMFLNKSTSDSYLLKPAFVTQRLVEQHFMNLEQDEQHLKIKQGLYNLISNIILFDADGSGEQFHFRFNMEHTASFRYLAYETQQQLRELYIHYFFRRQSDFWKKEALQKLPALKRSTNMMVCGEDLGMVPDCVPEIMQQLGLLSLEIQRM
ncbi:MAG: 4-alpha-glucanotransferase, partial [Sphingobacteriia bacterium]